MKQIKHIDIVIPVYRSKELIADLVAQIQAWHSSTNVTAHVIFVDDKSDDETYETLKKSLEKVNFSFDLLQMTKNSGQYTATAAGFYYSTAEWVATIDDDLQHNPFELDKLISAAEKGESDLIYGYYLNKQHSFIRNLGSKALKALFRNEGIDFDNVTSFRLIQNHVIAPFKESTRQVLFLDERLYNFSSAVEGVEVEHQKRSAGKSSHSYWKLIQLTLTIVLFHSSLPLKWITRLGLFSSLIFMFFVIYFVYNKLVNDAPLGFTALIVSLFFSTGLILLSLGIIGEYIRKIWVHQQRMTDVTVIKKQ